MAPEKEPVILKWNKVQTDAYPDEPSFNDVLDTACGRLWEKHVEYSIRRIREMDEILAQLEKELDDIIKTAETNASGTKTEPNRIRLTGRGTGYHGRKNKNFKK